MSVRAIQKTPVSKQAINPPKDFKEVGSTGLRRTGKQGTIYEEFLRDLYGIRAIEKFREMRDNDPVVGAMLFAIEMILRNVEWRVEGDDEELVEFIESCTQDMSHPWEDLIAEILSMLPYGFSWHEVVLKRREGESNDPSKRSRFKDGKIGWRKIPIRAQDTLSDWTFDDEGGIQAFNQIAPPNFIPVEIPIQRSLLFRVGLHKGNPEGRSILRNAYRPWIFKKHIEEIEAIGIERDLAGIPVAYRTAEIAAKYDDDLKDILSKIKRDEQEYILLPLAYDSEGRELLKFELLRAAGNRQIDTTAVLERLDRRIAMTVMADFLMLGQGKTGSWALADNKTEMFDLALGAIAKSIASVFNRVAIPKLLLINNIKTDKLPQLVPGEIAKSDLKMLGDFVTAMSGAGAPMFPDEDLENYLRKQGKLPPVPEDRKEMLTAMPQNKPGKNPSQTAGILPEDEDDDDEDLPEDDE